MHEAVIRWCEHGETVKTGWPAPALMQDDSRPLFRWFASKPDARRLVRESVARIAKEKGNG